MADAKLKQQRLNLLWTEDVLSAAWVKPHTERERRRFLEQAMWRKVETDGPDYRDDPRYAAMRQKMAKEGRFVMPSEVGL